MFILYILISVLILGLIYLSIGFIPYKISLFFCDYPGPKMIFSNHQMSTSKIDYLLVHGASLDARIWNGVLKRNKKKSMAAISLSRHNEGVMYADPTTAVTDLVEYLKNHKINKAIVGHSTAALWIAEAYSLYPDAFKEIQVILVAPSFGSNINKHDLQLLKSWNKLSWIVPKVMLKSGLMDSCQGDTKFSYLHAKEIYSYGRIFIFNSINYYNKLVKYSFDRNTLSCLDYFLKDNKDKIMLYISSSDKALNPKVTEDIAISYKLNYKIISGYSHIMLAADDKVWLGSQ